MAKDPAFLFYPGDWSGGTLTMSRFLKGCYMDLLIAQFNSGALSLEEVKTVLGSDFGQSWPSLQKKFSVTRDGFFFNERLQLEKEKRAAFCKKQAGRISSRHSKKLPEEDSFSTTVDTTECTTVDTTVLPKIENENRDLNEDLNSFRKGGLGENPYSPTFKQVEVYFSLKELGESDARRFFDHYEAVGWFVNGQPIRKWQPKADQWIRDDNGFSAKAKKQKAESGSARSKLAEMKKNVDQGGDNFLKKILPNEQTVPSLESPTVYEYPNSPGCGGKGQASDSGH